MYKWTTHCRDFPLRICKTRTHDRLELNEMIMKIFSQKMTKMFSQKIDEIVFASDEIVFAKSDENICEFVQKK
jgi:hypothetical protein